MIGDTEVQATVTRSKLNPAVPELPAARSRRPGPRRKAAKRTSRCASISTTTRRKSAICCNANHIADYDNYTQPSPLMNWIPVLLMTGLLVVLFIFMMRRMGGAGSPMAFGRSRGKLIAQEDIEVTFEDVAGIDEAVEELREVVEFLKTPEKYQRLGGRIPKGVLLVGPPGTGKTLLAKAVAGEAGVPFFSLSGSDFVEMFVGVGAARVRDMFQQAEQKAPCIIFIDELDALGKTRGSGNIGGHDEREQTLNALLVEMDGFGTNSGVIVMGATNRPETLDSALLRPGRFDRHVLVDRPDVGGRRQIIEVHLQNIKVDADVDVKLLAAITSGFVGADLANMVNEAALLAARKGRQVVTMADFNEAVERSSAGLEKKSRIMHEDEKLRVAYHEAGHALVASSLPNTDPVHKVSIIPRGLAALGLHDAAARAGSLLDDQERAGEPHPGALGRHGGRGNDLRRRFERRSERPRTGHGNRPQHGHGFWHEPAGPRELPRKQSQPVLDQRRHAADATPQRADRPRNRRRGQTDHRRRPAAYEAHSRIAPRRSGGGEPVPDQAGSDRLDRAQAADRGEFFEPDDRPRHRYRRPQAPGATAAGERHRRLGHGTCGRVKIGRRAEVAPMATVADSTNSSVFQPGPRLLTVADVAAMPTQLPSGPVDYELDNGRLVLMSPTGRRHGQIQSAIASALYSQGKQAGHGEAYVETGVILWRNPDRMVGPDASFVTNRSLPARESAEGFLETIPELVIEVRSKNDTAAEVDEKVADFLKAGVAIVWVVEPATETVVEYRSGQPIKTLGKADELLCEDVIPGFRLSLIELFK